MINLEEKKLLIASHNEGKISEFRELLNFFDVKIISSKELQLPEPVEDGISFEEIFEISPFGSSPKFAA